MARRVLPGHLAAVDAWARDQVASRNRGITVMQIMVALFSFLLGAVSVFAVELQLLNETLAPIRDLADALQDVLLPMLPGA